MTKMVEETLYAIETFTTTRKGYIVDDVDTNHYMRDFEMQGFPIQDGRAKLLLKMIEENFITLTFSRKWLNEDLKFDKVAVS